jgi:hypothetical protein
MEFESGILSIGNPDSGKKQHALDLENGQSACAKGGQDRSLLQRRRRTA